jgi:hypothetical protein
MDLFMMYEGLECAVIKKQDLIFLSQICKKWRWTSLFSVSDFADMLLKIAFSGNLFL